MSSNWSLGLLGDFIQLKRGYDLPQQKRQVGSVPVVSSAGISDSHSQAMAKGPGVVTGRYGTIGQVFYVERDFWPLNTTLYVSDFKGNNPKFISYFLQTLDFMAYSDKAAVPGINRNHLHVAQVKVPPLEEQERIADILGTLDDKIDLNRQINQTLEQMAQALFQSWFVDFEPVKAKFAAVAEGRDPLRAAMSSLSGKTDAELDECPHAQFDAHAATAALFPVEMEESVLGQVPKGWEVSTIGQEVSVLGGGTPSTANPAYWNGEFAWATPKDLSRLADKVLTGTERRITEAGVRNISSGQLSVGTVLLSSRAPIGYLALATIPVSINQGFIAMRCDARLPNMYVLQWATANLDAIKQRGSGTTFPEISKGNFRPMSVLVPDRKTLTAFQELTMPLYDQITTNVCETEALAALRDFLLPRLLSGELAVTPEEAEGLAGTGSGRPPRPNSGEPDRLGDLFGDFSCPPSNSGPPRIGG